MGGCRSHPRKASDLPDVFVCGAEEMVRWPDDRLKNFVLSLADADNTLSERARLVVLAALEGSNDLAEVLGDNVTSSELVESLTATEESAEPVGAYVRSHSRGACVVWSHRDELLYKITLLGGADCSIRSRKQSRRHHGGHDLPALTRFRAKLTQRSQVHDEITGA